MKILLLSFYYPPDLSAGSFRATALVKALLAARPDVEIVVVTTLPNRYQSFAAPAEPLEIGERLTIHRIAMPAHRNGFFDQARTYPVFARAAWKIAVSGKFDLVVATSGRSMTSALAAALSRRLNRPLYLDIRDIFVETIGDVLPGRTAFFVKPVASLIERWAIGRAREVNVVSGGFLDYFRPRYPRQSFATITNGIDDAFLAGLPPAPRHDDARLLVVYAGNIGDSQGLDIIVPALAEAMKDHASFRIIGDGGRRASLAQAVAEKRLDNVEILPPVERPRLIAHYAEADVLFLHLNDYDAFKRVLPSKLFEYAATGKPIWAGVGGFCARFVANEIVNAAVFAPCDAAGGLAAFSRLSLTTTDRAAFVETYRRTRLMTELASRILVVAQTK